MNKILIGLIVAILSAGIIGLIVFVMFVLTPTTPSGSDQTGTNSNLPTSNPSTVTVNNSGGTSSGQNGAGFTLATSDGGTIQTTDIRKDPALKEDTVNKGYYYFGGQTGSASSSAAYIIEYIDKTQFFNVILMQEPIGQAREQAQSYLTQHLGISQDQLCRLNYMVTVPYSVNQDFSSVDLRFSICTDATPL